MNKYICKGAFVQRKDNPVKQGIVYVLNKKSGIVIVQQGENSYWADSIKNVELVSYKGVE